MCADCVEEELWAQDQICPAHAYSSFGTPKKRTTLVLQIVKCKPVHRSAVGCEQF